MLAIYPAKYRDNYGEEVTTIQNDGKSLRMIARGVEFTGSDFDLLETTNNRNVDLSSFTFSSGALCACVIECEIPIPIIKNDQVLQGALSIRLDLGSARPGGKTGIDKEVLLLELQFDTHAFKSCGKHGWFVDELDELQSQLPQGTYIKSCFNCNLSLYSPFGFGLFGCLACFRNNKAGVRAAKDKRDVFALFDEGIAEWVQETYLCPEFEKREHAVEQKAAT